jgi:KUP system potassium uptake protein
MRKNGKQPKKNILEGLHGFGTGVTKTIGGSVRDPIKALGLVFGDIGTSPIYTLAVIFFLIDPTEGNVLGVCSLVVWSLFIVVMFGYITHAMNLDRHGEGGTLILKSILDGSLRSKRAKKTFGLIAFFGISLLLGEGVLTPSISILSAVEGMRLIPSFEGIGQISLVIIAILIAIALFIFQKRGTDKVATAFGPIMTVWFLAIGTIGAVTAFSNPVVFKAFSPWYAFAFLRNNGIVGFFLLSQVILCVTGVEALYADMGHLGGRKPIARAWYFVFVSLVFSYLGQGAYVLDHPDSMTLFFAMAKDVVPVLYVPFLVLTVAATVIASQALISGAFSIIYQGINIGAFPRLKVDFTSSKIKSQIYIGSVNFILLAAVIFMLLLFKNSASLAVAYGLSVTITMCITGFLMIVIFIKRRSPLFAAGAVFLTLVELAFLVANVAKIPHGGYWSLVLASLPLALIILWTEGQAKIHRSLKPLRLDTFLVSYEQVHAKEVKIPGLAVFFVGDHRLVSPYIVHCVFRSGIVYERNILLSIHRTDKPSGSEVVRETELGSGLESFEIKAGYREEVDVMKMLKQNGIEPRILFYGAEEIRPKRLPWRFFSVIKRLASSFVMYYRLPASKVHGIITRVEI